MSDMSHDQVVEDQERWLSIEHSKRVEPTKEWLDALIDDIMNGHAHFALMPDEERKEPAEALRRLRDAVLASQPERVECPTNHTATGYTSWLMWFKDHGFFVNFKGTPHCPDCGQSLRGAGE